MINCKKFIKKNIYYIIFLVLIVLLYTQTFKAQENFAVLSASTDTCNIDFCRGNYEFLLNDNGTPKGCFQKCNTIISKGLRGVTSNSNQMICKYTDPSNRIHTVSRDFTTRRLLNEFGSHLCHTCANNYSIFNDHCVSDAIRTNISSSFTNRMCKEQNGVVINNVCNYCRLTSTEPTKRPIPSNGKCTQIRSINSVR
jgi:hypothetical protein